MTTAETVDQAAAILFESDTPSGELSADQISAHLETIEALPFEEMRRLWKFADSGHVYFDNRYSAIGEAFVRRFAKFGGFRAGNRPASK